MIYFYEIKFIEKDNSDNYPGRYANMFDALRSFGCTDAEMEKCLTVKTFSEFKQNLKKCYVDNPTLCTNIEQRVTYFYNN